ncbi:MAG: DUF4296 domain-containing protein [Bacteroidales bacterium]|nr:DUF4296 domain-containing protein [Bacteroidales bacterium]
MKRSALLFIIICSLLTSSCHKKQVVAEKPENLINRKTMVQVLTDSYIAEALVYATLDSMSLPETDNLIRASYKEIFDRYHITKDQFVTSIEYYISDKEVIEKMMEEVLTNLSLMKQNSNLPDSLLHRPLESIMHSSNLATDTLFTDTLITDTIPF